MLVIESQQKVRGGLPETPDIQVSLAFPDGLLGFETLRAAGLEPIADGQLDDSVHPLYGKCRDCGTLVLRRTLTEAELKSFYGYQQYWHEHQSKVTGHPTIEQRAKNDFQDRIPIWYRVLTANHHQKATT